MYQHYTIQNKGKNTINYTIKFIFYQSMYSKMYC